jgi:hypothetical protein
MANRQRYNIPNESFPGVTTTPVAFTITVNGDPLDLTGAEITLQLRMQASTPAVDTLSTVVGNDPDQRIEITNAAAGQFEIKAFDFKTGIPAATYQYDIVIKTATNTLSYIYGTWTVADLITQK